MITLSTINATDVNNSNTKHNGLLDKQVLSSNSNIEINTKTSLDSEIANKTVIDSNYKSNLNSESEMNLKSSNKTTINSKDKSNLESLKENTETKTLETNKTKNTIKTEDTKNINKENDNYPGKTIIITDDNYEEYFNKYTGEILSDDLFNNGDILKIGNITNKLFKINKRLFITSTGPDDKIRNGGIFLLKGSDGSTITKLNIINNESIVNLNGYNLVIPYGLSLNSTNNIIISFNTLDLTKCEFGFSLYAYNSSYDQIIYNSFHTGNSERETTSCLVMDLSNFNNISYNNLTTIQSNVIYLNHLGWAGVKDVCIGTYIANNYLHTDIPSPMSYGMQIVYGYHNNTTVINNTIDSVSDAINIDGENITIIGNKMINITESGINNHGKNILIENNSLISYQNINGGGIKIFGSNVSISNNNLKFNNGSYFGISIYSENTTSSNNNITLKNYGIGFILNNNNITIINNTILAKIDTGIYLNGSNNKILNNIIESDAYGINANITNDRIMNNTIMGNRIKSDKDGIAIYGLVYHSIIGNNIIDTNGTFGIYRNITDNKSDSLFDNIINGVLTDPTAITINDGNFYDFFTKDGYLNFTFKEGANRVIILTVLTNKKIIIDKTMYLMSNMNNNFLFNVTIDLIKGSEGTIIKDLNIYNLNNDKAIKIANTSDIEITGNNITLINSNKAIKMINGISIENSNNNNINKNNIYIETLNSGRGIDILNNSDETKISISKNNIVIKADSGEGIRTESLNNSQIEENYINILSNNTSYGINLKENNNFNNISIDSNSIIIYSNNSAYPIISNNINNSLINKNKIYSNSTNTNTILVNNGSNLKIKENIFKVFANNNEDNIIINLLNKSNRIDISKNIIETNLKNIIDYYKYSVKIEIENNTYVIGDYNFLNYFTNKTNGRLNSSIKKGDKILFKNLTTVKSFIIDIPLNISSYDSNSIISSIIIFNNESSKSTISNLIFNTENELKIILNNTENIKFNNNIIRINNTINGSIIIIKSGLNNSLSDNDIIINGNLDSGIINITDSENTIFKNNNIEGNTTGLLILIENINSKTSKISNNNIKINTEIIKLIESLNSNNTVINSNKIKIITSKGSAYFGNNTNNETIENNNIIIINNGKTPLNDDFKDLILGNQTGIYCVNINSTIIKNNHIESLNSTDDYCIYIDSKSNNTYIIYNYLVSDNNRKTANIAVYYKDSKVYENTPCEIYISTKGSDEYGNGTKENPYKTLKYAISKTFNNGFIYIEDGDYFENDIIINKNITISAINKEKVKINLNTGRLFTINNNTNLTIKNLIFTKGNSINGTVFFNNGILNIINSKFKDNTALNANKTEVSGFGGVATNYGDLNIINSSFNNNIAHKGGVIRNYKNLRIYNSTFYNNSATEGGVIYNEGNCNLYNSSFYNNTAINSVRFCITYKSNKEDVSKCCNVGSGGVIYNNGNSKLIVNNCKFNYNSAVNGGSIYFSSNLKTPDNSTLEIYNSTINKNTASKNGGGIYGNVNKLTIKSTNITNNEANNNGGGLSINSLNGIIDSSKITHNIAENGGGISLSGNITITNTFISNNTASSGGAIDYNGEIAYNHLINHVNIYNSTISNNRGLNNGGAFNVENGNIKISNSNIVNNYAPEGSTINAYNKNIIDVDNHNWWGSSKGPDDSVWRTADLSKRDWARTEVIWYKTDDDNKPSGNPSGNNPHTTVPGTLPGGTGAILIPNTGEGTQGTGNGQGQEGNGNGSGTGTGNGNGGTINGQGNGNGNGGNGNSNGQGSGGTSGNSHGVGSVGLSGKSAGGSSSSSSSYGDSSGSISSGLSKAYELSKEKLANTKKVDPNTLIYVIILFSILIYIGYRKEKRNDKFR
ncbi:hypothetical protein BGI41_01525 [Methanobrevibacter sp. 87.7]|uniref:right-handed parallel beta-helix repeat-containing protein n=1 Tax=Methanobrevibacter sp. 87.7 TaxID=387957 RepID=UPI000B503D63|nr:right-handed parallel beta-helix repeat-containing protein [Methanobrevibacter sp. 87.7]OWT33615.1 hypothetical protein BGI41_01525 [Methanobrevibacter sp. 87.7]